MSKNNKGYLLAESIIAIAVVATAITLVYAASINNYIKQDNAITKYNTTDGLYVVKEINKYMEIENINATFNNLNCNNITDQIGDLKQTLNVYKLFYCSNDLSSLEKDLPYQIRNEILNIDTDDNCSNRLIAVLKSNKQGYGFAALGVNCVEEK